MQILKIEYSGSDYIRISFEQIFGIISARCSTLVWSIQFLDMLNLNKTPYEQIARHLSALGFRTVEEVENAANKAPKG